MLVRVGPGVLVEKTGETYENTDGVTVQAMEQRIKHSLDRRYPIPRQNRCNHSYPK